MGSFEENNLELRDNKISLLPEVSHAERPLLAGNNKMVFLIDDIIKLTNGLEYHSNRRKKQVH